MLWESKNEFLENQKNEKSKELEEYNQKFEMAMQKMNQRSQTEKDKALKNNEAIINSMEQRTSEQEKNLKENISKLKADKERMKKEFEAELSKVKSSNSGAKGNDEDLSEALTLVEGLKEEVRTLKSERGKGISDLKLTMEADKKALQSKTEELNAKLKYTEQEKNKMYMDNEKIRAKMRSETENLNNDLEEAIDEKERLQKQVDTLRKELDKQKNMLPPVSSRGDKGKSKISELLKNANKKKMMDTSSSELNLRGLAKDFGSSQIWKDDMTDRTDNSSDKQRTKNSF